MKSTLDKKVSLTCIHEIHQSSKIVCVLQLPANNSNTQHLNRITFLSKFKFLLLDMTKLCFLLVFCYGFFYLPILCQNKNLNKKILKFPINKEILGNFYINVTSFQYKSLKMKRLTTVINKLQIKIGLYKSPIYLKFGLVYLTGKALT